MLEIQTWKAIFVAIASAIVAKLRAVLDSGLDTRITLIWGKWLNDLGLWNMWFTRRNHGKTW